MRLIDLSVTIEQDAVSELVPPKIEFRSHTGAGLAFFKEAFGITEDDLVWSGGTAPGDEITAALLDVRARADHPAT